MKEKIQLLAAALALILLLCGCAARGTTSNDAKPAAGDVTDSNAAPYEVPAFRDSVFNEDEATAFGSGEIDLSQLEGGIIGVKAQSDTRLKMQIVCGEDKYNYDLPNDGTATFSAQYGKRHIHVPPDGAGGRQQIRVHRERRPRRDAER